MVIVVMVIIVMVIHQVIGADSSDGVDSVVM